ncbi:hypothetical protein [Streptomyces sp. NPDC007905]|uniref:hypothetical protein n=1 Tax=Streptomyces sp. NPDC007905 TaxID=3364788 RepID=UPI0036E92F44
MLLGGLTGEGCCHDLRLHRLDTYPSPLPPIGAAAMRSDVNQVRRFARWLEEAEEAPLHDGRWEIAVRTAFALPVWTAGFVREWSGGTLEPYCGGGRHGIPPLYSPRPTPPV